MINEYGAGDEIRIGMRTEVQRKPALVPIIHHKCNVILPGIIPKLPLWDTPFS
jgi:hypothetical protein